ncbi:MAG TPA: hypothetical protein VFX97_15650 [Pyrinomonadaceae bacterium]|nr:hypothetical protein [Pyrinomonadaceae bacterium]
MHDTPRNLRNKCAQCGLVNAASDSVCRRCGAELAPEPVGARSVDEAPPKKTRGFLKRVTWIIGATLILLVIFYLSLLLTSDGLQTAQREQVDRSIAILEQKGFSNEVFVLKRLASFRTSDNWLNAYVGHRDAYAATNFPFEVVTLYSDFFSLPIDDTERAAVLLHEARHLLGDDEDAALELTWKSKRQLGWTEDKYGQTLVWDATEDLTRPRFAYMFSCGADGQADCYR